MRHWLAALSTVLAAGCVVLAASCGGASTKPELSTTVPPGWNTHASAEGLTLSIDPPRGPADSSVEIRGSISANLGQIGDKITVEFWREGSFRVLAKVGRAFKGGSEVWPTTVSAIVERNGTFNAGWIRVPQEVQIGDELRLVEPGQYWFALVLDDKHAIYAPFEVTTPTPMPMPTPTPAPYLSLGSFQFLDSTTGWLSADSCLDRRPGDWSWNKCKADFYGTTDGGKKWRLLSHEAIGGFRFTDAYAGLAIKRGTDCSPSVCPGVILRTTDGGVHWADAYSFDGRASDLTVVGGEAWVLFSCSGQSTGGQCPSYLLKSQDGGLTWNQSILPVNNSRIGISRPTARDAFIAGGGQLLATHDGGATWQTLPRPADFRESVTTFFLTPQQGWLLVGWGPSAGAEAKELFTTNDGGLTWLHLSGSLQHPGEYVPGDLSSFGYVGGILFTSAQDGWIRDDILATRWLSRLEYRHAPRFCIPVLAGATWRRGHIYDWGGTNLLVRAAASSQSPLLSGRVHSFGAGRLIRHYCDTWPSLRLVGESTD